MAGRLRIPAALQGLPAVDRRRDKRVPLPHDPPGGIDFVVVTDIAPGGARLVTPVPIEIGSAVRLKLPLLEPVVGTIVWVSSRLAGCAFAEPLHPALLRVLVAAGTADAGAWRSSLAGGPFAAR
jgi:hypothetical protein